MQAVAPGMDINLLHTIYELPSVSAPAYGLGAEALPACHLYIFALGTYVAFLQGAQLAAFCRCAGSMYS